MNSITDKESFYLTSKEAIESTKPIGCSSKKEMCTAFAISKTTLNKLLAGELDKVKLTRKSVHYDEDDLVTDLRDALKDFIKCEVSLGEKQKDIELAIKNIIKEAFAEYKEDE